MCKSIQDDCTIFDLWPSTVASSNLFAYYQCVIPTSASSLVLISSMTLLNPHLKNLFCGLLLRSQIDVRMAPKCLNLSSLIGDPASNKISLLIWGNCDFKAVKDSYHTEMHVRARWQMRKAKADHRVNPHSLWAAELPFNYLFTFK